MPTRVKCLHALAAHSLAAGPGVNPIGDLALERSSWSPAVCQCPVLAVDDTRPGGPAEDSGRPADRRMRPTARRSRRRRGSRSPSAHAARGADPAHADTVRDREYWLADYGFTTAWNTTRGEGVTVAVIDTGVDGSVAELRRGVVGGTDVSGPRHRRTGRRRSATTTQPRHHGRVAARRARARRRQRRHRRRARGRAARASRSPSAGHGPRLTTSRSPRPCAGRSTTAPTSSTCRSPATPATGPRAGTTRSSTRSSTTWSWSPPPATAAAARREVGAPATIPACSRSPASTARGTRASTLARRASRSRSRRRARTSSALRPDGELRAVERHERRGADRAGLVGARALRVSRPRRRERHQPHHRARPIRSPARPCPSPLYGYGLIDPAAASPPRSRGRREPDGRPGGVDPHPPASASRPRRPAPQAGDVPTADPPPPVPTARAACRPARHAPAHRRRSCSTPGICYARIALCSAHSHRGRLSAIPSR